MPAQSGFIPLMKKHFVIILFIFAFIYSCKAPVPKQSDVVRNLVQLRSAVKENLKARIDFIADSDSIEEQISNPTALILFYERNKYSTIWSDSSLWMNNTDSLLKWLCSAPDNGIDTSLLQFTKINSLIHLSKTDTNAVRDAALYAHAEILLTDAYFNYANRLCFSQSAPDSIRLKKEKKFSDSMLVTLLLHDLQAHQFSASVSALEPHHPQYLDLKSALKKYREEYLPSSWSKVPDTPSFTSVFKNSLKERLLQSCDYDSTLHKSDSMKLAIAIKNFQKKSGLFPDGKPGLRTLKAMNYSAQDRIAQINLMLDWWRAEPDSFPEKYLFVNLPSFQLQYWAIDTVRLESRIICGSLHHNSPLLNSAVNYFITYPFWVVPFSIATKEILPHLQKDTSYLAKHNMEVLNSAREVIDYKPINWKKYSRKYFPFILRQKEGLDNSLGVVKFIFPSKYGIYLHETDARSLFKKDFRALSHGCIRVEQAVQLAYSLALSDSVKYPADSITHWLSTKTKKQINLTARVPVYIRYYLCDVRDGELIFYEDIYSYCGKK